MSERVILDVAANGETEIVYRTGEALPLREPVKVVLSGLIDTPSRFFQSRIDQIDKEKSHVVIDRNKLSIYLTVDENNPLGSFITGSIKYNEDLAGFFINKNKTFSLKELAALLRMKRIFFSEREEYNSTIERLYKFEAHLTTKIKDADDRKGNIDKQLKKEMISNSPAGFKLTIPIFRGEPSSQFFVDILADVSDVQTKFWLESPDLIELEYKISNELMDREAAKFANEIVVLEV